MKTGGVLITALLTAVVSVFAYDQYVKYKTNSLQQKVREAYTSLPK